MKIFADWKNDVEIQLEKLAPILDAELPDDLNSLEDQLRSIDSFGYRVLKLYSESEVYLRIASATYLESIQDQKMPALEREIYLENATAEEHAVYRILKGLLGDRNNSGLIPRKIMLGQTFLANHRALNTAKGV